MTNHWDTTDWALCIVFVTCCLAPVVISVYLMIENHDLRKRNNRQSAAMAKHAAMVQRQAEYIARCDEEKLLSTTPRHEKTVILDCVVETDDDEAGRIIRGVLFGGPGCDAAGTTGRHHKDDDGC